MEVDRSRLAQGYASGSSGRSRLAQYWVMDEVPKTWGFYTREALVGILGNDESLVSRGQLAPDTQGSAKDMKSKQD